MESVGGEDRCVWLLHESAGELQEGGFEIDFFFAEEQECEVGVDQSGGDGAVVFDGGFQSCFDDLVFGDGHLFDAVKLFEEFSGLIGAFADADLQEDALTGFSHDFGDVAIDDHVTFLDHANAGADICEFGEDVAADDDSFLHFAQSAEEPADFDASSGVKSAGGFIEEEDFGVMEECASESDALSLSA